MLTENTFTKFYSSIKLLILILILISIKAEASQKINKESKKRNRAEITKENINKDNNKIAIVDVQNILDNSLAVNELKKVIDSISKEFQSEFNKNQEDLKNQEAKLLELRTQVQQEEFQKQVLKFNHKVTNTQKELQEKKIKLEQAHAKSMNKVNELALTIISDISRERDYVLVIPSSQVLFARERINITPEVLKRLNAKLPSVRLNFR